MSAWRSREVDVDRHRPVLHSRPIRLSGREENRLAGPDSMLALGDVDRLAPDDHVELGPLLDVLGPLTAPAHHEADAHAVVVLEQRDDPDLALAQSGPVGLRRQVEDLRHGGLLWTVGASWRSLHHVISPGEDGGWDRQAQDPGGLEIDDELELRGLLDRQIGRLHSLEDLVRVYRGVLVHVGQAGAVEHQTARVDELALTVDRGQAAPGRQLHDLPPVGDERGIRKDHERVAPVPADRGERLVEGEIAYLVHPHLQAQGSGYVFALGVKLLGVWRTRGGEHGHACHSWERLLDDLQALDVQGLAERGHTGDVTARPAHAGHQAVAD